MNNMWELWQGLEGSQVVIVNTRPLALLAASITPGDIMAGATPLPVWGLHSFPRGTGRGEGQPVWGLHSSWALHSNPVAWNDELRMHVCLGCV